MHVCMYVFRACKHTIHLMFTLDTLISYRVDDAINDGSDTDNISNKERRTG